jgi:predicted regulator of Ras-like GTPase activity (Roadblock/LC7/MglB family)
MFQTVLANLVERTPGTRWAMIVGADGVALEANSENMGQAAEVLAAEYATLFRASRKVTAQTATGDLQGTILTTDCGRVVLQTLTSEYFLLLYLDPLAHAGKALFEISRARDAIVEELAY